MTADDPQARWVRRATLLTALAALVVVSWPRTQTMSPTGSAPAPRPSTDPTPTVPAVWPAPSPTALAVAAPSAATPAVGARGPLPSAVTGTAVAAAEEQTSPLGALDGRGVAAPRGPGPSARGAPRGVRGGPRGPDSPASPTATVAPLPSPPTPSATPALTPPDRLARALAPRGLTVEDLDAIPELTTALDRYAARATEPGSLDALMAALDGARLPDALVRAKLDRVGRALRAAAARLPPAELERREQRYLDLEVRLAQAPSREDRHSLVREAARLLRDP